MHQLIVSNRYPCCKTTSIFWRNHSKPKTCHSRIVHEYKWKIQHDHTWPIMIHWSSNIREQLTINNKIIKQFLVRLRQALGSGCKPLSPRLSWPRPETWSTVQRHSKCMTLSNHIMSHRSKFLEENNTDKWHLGTESSWVITCIYDDIVLQAPGSEIESHSHLRSWRHGKGEGLTNIEHVPPFQGMAQQAQHYWNESMNSLGETNWKFILHNDSRFVNTQNSPQSGHSDLYQNWPDCALATSCSHSPTVKYNLKTPATPWQRPHHQHLHTCTQLSSHFSARFPTEPLSDFLSLSLKRAAGPETHENV